MMTGLGRKGQLQDQAPLEMNNHKPDFSISYRNNAYRAIAC